MKNIPYTRKPKTLHYLKHEIEVACPAISPAVMREYAAVLRPYQQCV
jgi:hypothetical protein